MISVEIDTSDAIVYVMFSKWELSVDDGFVVVNVVFFLMYLVGFCYNCCCESVIQLPMVFMVVVSDGCDYSWISMVL